MTLYAIGDIQGCHGPFERLLDAIGFAPDRDRLWLTGDLVNRGPDSAAVLRRVIALGDSVRCVLGNHDLHLLAAAAGVRTAGHGDSLGDVLRADDRGVLIDWLRMQPLLIQDTGARRALVHAGVPPQWDMADAGRQAADVERVLRSDDWRSGLGRLFGNEPSAWSDTLAPDQRRRYTVNALTRMRFCGTDGRLDFEHRGPPGSQPDGLTPWFNFADRRAAGWHIVCGHWAALGLLRRADVTAVDSGCVWGGQLTAVPLSPPGEPVTVQCDRGNGGVRPQPVP